MQIGHRKWNQELQTGKDKMLSDMFKQYKAEMLKLYYPNCF